ncbi:hypothetical protein QYE76_036940 [Lolium multiflorum]|uniref:Jacalin-type lectin domain-containing protein n=1 Tax=Lolium multiflorum TaxID=4521 RepID=A0AAD8R2X0_LOLMU|nr:hypothetical protein QYE76_036940 [Lolium multiflorum]
MQGAVVRLLAVSVRAEVTQGRGASSCSGRPGSAPGALWRGMDVFWAPLGARVLTSLVPGFVGAVAGQHQGSERERFDTVHVDGADSRTSNFDPEVAVLAGEGASNGRLWIGDGNIPPETIPTLSRLRKGRTSSQPAIEKRPRLGTIAMEEIRNEVAEERRRREDMETLDAPKKLGPSGYGGIQGTAKEINSNSVPKTLKSVSIWSKGGNTGRINAISFTYYDKDNIEVNEGPWGTTDGTPNVISIGHDEYLTKLCVTTANNCVTSLTFNTSKPAVHGPMGKEPTTGDKAFTIDVDPDSIVAFFGRYDHYLRAIGAYSAPQA